MSSAYSSVPQVIDYLYAKLQAALAGRADLVVVYGYPATAETPDIVAIGGTTTPVADGEIEARALGAKRIEELYELTLTISSYRGGSSADPANGEKVARDAAFSLYDLVIAAIGSDLSLGGNCLWALPLKLAVQGTNAETAAAGVTVDLTFNLRVKAQFSL